MSVKKYFNDWNLYEKLYLILGILISILLKFVFESSLLYTLYTATYITNALLTTKGKPETYIFGLTGIVFYSIISYEQRYYGEIFISLFLTSPILIYGLINWLKNQNKENTNIIISTLSKKEIIIIILSQIICFWPYYYLLKAFNTEMLIISTISIIMSLLANYFSARRSEISYYFYIANDFVGVTLWITPVLNGETQLLSVAAGPILLFINDLYGIYNWKRMKKVQIDKKATI